MLVNSIQMVRFTIYQTQQSKTMNCKNCNTPLGTDHKYCNQCGAKVVSKRISLNHMIASLLSLFGWDNRFLVTLKDLLIRPHVVIDKYLTGTRKRYTEPFTFFAIGATLSVLVLNFYSDEIIKLSTSAGTKPSEIIYDAAPNSLSYEKVDKEEHLNNQQALVEKAMNFMLSNYYYLSFLFLPFYAFISLLVFGKPNNYGEQLIINTYLQGVLLFIGVFLYIITIFIGYDVFNIGSILLSAIYYCYAFKKYRNYTFGKTIIKLLKFFVVMLGILVTFILLGGIVGFILGRLGIIS